MSLYIGFNSAFLETETILDRIMEKITIREFIPQDNRDDFNILLPAFLQIWNADENLRYLSYPLKPVDAETVRTWLENHKDQDGRYFCAVNEVGKVLGISVIIVSPNESFEIFGIGIRPDSKRQGIGRSLIENALELATELGFKSIDTFVFSDNSNMFNVLGNLEFEPSGMGDRKRANGVDVVHMKKYL